MTVTLSRPRGFTLVEMIVVIAITGVIAAIVAVFLRAPVMQYVDVARRADMSDAADTALRRMARDIRLALPNSVRVAGTCSGTTPCFIEFLPTGSATCPASGCLGGGRYRAGGPGDELSFEIADDGFEVLGPMPPMAAGDQVVVYNLGLPGADAYAGSNRSAVTAAPAGNLVRIAPFAFPFSSPGKRFHVISTPVTYACLPAPNGAGGVLRRYWGYPIQASQANVDSAAELDALVSPQSAARGSALLATNVSGCRFTYTQAAIAQRTGLVTLDLRLGTQGETITLYSATHVSNQP